MYSRLNFDAIQTEINSRLDPDSIKIDGRDLRDRLAFVASIAEVVVYYDENNQASGNWLAMVLKDPIILLAVISKTQYQDVHFHFAQVKEKYKELQYQISANDSQNDPDTASSGSHIISAEKQFSVQQLFSILDKMFLKIDEWTHYLFESSLQFTLRDYIKQQIPTQMAQLVVQRVRLQSFLTAKFPDCLSNLPELNTTQFSALWQLQSANRGERPSDVTEALQLLEDLYKAAFEFFVLIITEAKVSFYKLVFERNDFPDTSLIIACNELLRYSQAGLNRFSRKHLDFYYKKLLHQHLRGAQADSTHICLTLNDKVTSLDLVAGTEFVAGTYADKSNILFSNDQEAEINQISLVSIESSSYSKKESLQKSTISEKAKEKADEKIKENADGSADPIASKETNSVPQYQQLVETLPDSTEVITNQQGQIQASEWFGKNQSTAVQQGFALASPMFYLSNGTRDITLTFTFDTEVAEETLAQALISVSTQKGWQLLPIYTPPNTDTSNDGGETDTDSSTNAETAGSETNANTDTSADAKAESADNATTAKTTVKETASVDEDTKDANATKLASKIMPKSYAYWKQGDSDKQLILHLHLDKSFAALTYFKTAPTGYDSDQCYCQILLPDTVNLLNAVRIQQLDIGVEVSDDDSVALSTDGALLINNKPMMIFGASANVGSQCFVSCPEAFSKPLTAMALTLTWDNLDDDLSVYFSAYNDYLKTIEAANTPPAGSDPTSTSDLPDHYTNTAYEVAWAAETSEGWIPTKASIKTIKLDDEASDHDSNSKDLPWYKRLFGAAEKEVEKIGDEIKSAEKELKKLFTEPKELYNDLKSLIKGEESLEDITQDIEKLDGVSTVITKPTDETQLFSQLKDSHNAPKSIYLFTFAEGFRFAEQAVSDLATINNPSLRFTVSGPTDAFGNNTYAPAMTTITMNNATYVMSLFKKPRGDNDDIVQEALPNPPLILKASQARLHYQAAQTIDFTQATQSFSQDFTLLHIGHPNTYVYFQQDTDSDTPSTDLRNVALQPASTNITSESSDADSEANSTSPGCALFQGVCASASSVNISLQQIVAPCRLNVFIELSQDISADQHQSEVFLYYWSTSGWQPIGVLTDNTQGLTCSGIITLDILEDIWLDSDVFTPVSDKPPASPLLQSQLLLTQTGGRKVSVTYCNTQGVKLSRVKPIPLLPGEMPSLDALSITATAQKQAAISALVQPFASVGGNAAENQSLFNTRVSQRLKTKDRASSDQDFAILIQDVDPEVYFVRRLASPRAGTVKLGLVQQYSSSATSNAFKPVVPRADLVLIKEYLNSRISAMSRVSVCNLQHTGLSVDTQLVISEDTNANELQTSLLTGISLYLSPWITADQTQYSLTEGLSKADLTRFIASYTDVLAVSSLALTPDESVSDDSSDDESSNNESPKNSSDNNSDILTPKQASHIWISGANHNITFTRATTVTNGSNNGTSNGNNVAMPQNVLIGASA